MDSSTLISLSSNCMMTVFRRYCEKNNISPMITPAVYEESISRPWNIKRYELNAVRIKDAVDSGLMIVSARDGFMASESEKLMSLANNIASIRGSALSILHRGEAESLALAKKADAKAIAVDERTTRSLVESPQSMLFFLRKRYGEKIAISERNAQEFMARVSGIQVVRSVELISLSYLDSCYSPDLPNSKKSLEAALYSAKFSGCSVSFGEISNYLSRAR